MPEEHSHPVIIILWPREDIVQPILRASYGFDLTHLPVDQVREQRFYQSVKKVEPVAVTMRSSLAA